MARRKGNAFNKFIGFLTVLGVGAVAYDFLINKPGNRWIPLIDMFDERTEEGRFFLGQWYTFFDNIASGNETIANALGPYFKGVSERLSNPSIITKPILGSDDEWANILSFGSASAQKENDERKTTITRKPTGKDLDKMIADAITGNFKPYPTTKEQIRNRLKNTTRIYNTSELKSELDKLVTQAMKSAKDIPTKTSNPFGDFGYWFQKNLGLIN